MKQMHLSHLISWCISVGCLSKWHGTKSHTVNFRCCFFLDRILWTWSHKQLCVCVCVVGPLNHPKRNKDTKRETVNLVANGKWVSRERKGNGCCKDIATLVKIDLHKCTAVDDTESFFFTKFLRSAHHRKTFLNWCFHANINPQMDVRFSSLNLVALPQILLSFIRFSRQAFTIAF